MPGASTAGLPGGLRAHLVARLRTLLGSAAAAYTDDELREYLDSAARPATAFARLIGWTDDASVVAVYAATLPAWDDGGWVLTPDPTDYSASVSVTSDPLAGRWTVTDTAGEYPPPSRLRVDGVVYDLFGAAAEVLSTSGESRVVEFTTSGGESLRTEDSDALIARYRSQSWAGSLTVERDDSVGTAAPWG